MPGILVLISTKAYFTADRFGAILLVSLSSPQQSLANLGSSIGGKAVT
jgi:hypothetical protein